ncbi:hypothetical protein [Salirhabdus salicampi]|uniref:hypothetical protein n=1 Tax=Salirhabdus salicampi TaxID=476102 RepID=UPI0020C5A20E|nr:hypothetical protein [Salirhabdus salicampi]MCP8617471.1 hypothetical protein [Salirhabdus salicampi]
MKNKWLLKLGAPFLAIFLMAACAENDDQLPDDEQPAEDQEIQEPTEEEMDPPADDAGEEDGLGGEGDLEDNGEGGQGEGDTGTGTEGGDAGTGTGTGDDEEDQ